jgi:hypothetical protein
MERTKAFDECVVENQIDVTINEFNGYCKGENFKDFDENSIQKFYTWFEEEYRPQVINNDMIQPLKSLKVVDNERLEKLKSFYKDCVSCINILENEHKSLKGSMDEGLIRDIYTFLEQLSSIIKHFDKK